MNKERIADIIEAVVIVVQVALIVAAVTFPIWGAILIGAIAR